MVLAEVRKEEQLFMLRQIILRHLSYFSFLWPQGLLTFFPFFNLNL